MKTLLALLLFFSIGLVQAAPFEGWTDEEKAWFAASELVQVVDYQTTRNILYNQSNRDYYEVNPIVGHHPSPNRLMAFEIGTLVGNYFFTDWLEHDNRITWLKWHTTIEMIVIQHNVSIGARISF